jgi:hypothetical protein
MSKKTKISLLFAIILCIAICPITYFVYKFNVISSWDLVKPIPVIGIPLDILVHIPTPFVVGAVFCIFLFVIQGLKMKPLWIASFGVLGALGGAGYHLIEQPSMLQYYPLFPELALIFAGVVYLAIICNYSIIVLIIYTVKKRKARQVALVNE